MLRVFGVSDGFCYLTHGFDTDDAFQSQVGLQGKPPSKVVGRY